MKSKKKATKPRDPFVQHLVKKKQGPHGKTLKAARRQYNIETKKEVTK